MIRLLSKETIDKIAAGEVVERPENVVKELLDNAIDSGASAVTVEIREGGTALIRVTDNGSGISREELPAAFVRHATSKLSTAEDLLTLTTMGFRGEALASIAGVAKVEMITKRREDLTGTRYVIEGGNEISVREIGVPDGTTVIVRDLFFNVPVRRQFLKQPKTEASYVREIAEKAALSFPGISFSFLSDGRTVFHTSGSGKLRDVIYTIYGGETVNGLLPVEYSSSEGKVSGFLSKPSFSRTRRDSEIYFINGRFVRSSVIDKAIETAYEGYLMQHRFPFTILMITAAPEKIDVNIHPKKTEVRFSDDEKIFDLIFTAVKETLSRREHIEDALRRKEEEKKPESTLHYEPFEEQGRKAASAAETVTVLRDALREIPGTSENTAGHGGKTGSAEHAGTAWNTETAGCAGTAEKPAEKAGEPGLPAGAGEGLNGLFSGRKAKAAGGSGIQAEDSALPGSGKCFSSIYEPPGPDENAPMRQAETPERQTSASAEGTEPQQPGRTGEKSDSGQHTGKDSNSGQHIRKDSNSGQRDGKNSALFDEDRGGQLRFLDPEAGKHYRFIGQVFDTYWLIEYRDALYLIDQHAAHEKVNYEKLTARLESGEVTAQNILPVLLTVSAREAVLLEDRLEDFAASGFEIESAGDRDFIVRTVPAMLPELSQKDLLQSMIEGLSENGAGLDELPLREKIASMSCKAAVKGNRRLTEQEMRALTEELLQLKDPYHCPHGRPVMVKFSKAELDRMFRRIV